MEESYDYSVYEDPHLELDETLIWIRKPEKYVESVTYTAYGNEPETATEYVACAFIVTIPSFNHTVRKDIVTKSASVDVVKVL